MKKFDELFDNITTIYKQKIFGKYLQVIFKNKMFKFTKDIIFLLNDDYSLLSLFMLLNAKKYIYKDLKIIILNSSSLSKSELLPYLDSNIKHIKIKKENYIFNDIKTTLKNNKITLKNKAFIFNDNFDDQITYIMNSLLNKGKLVSLNPIEKKNNYFVFRPNILLRERDIISILNKYSLSYSSFSSLSFEKENKNDLIKIKNIILKIKEETNQAEMNIFDALNNVILDKVISYKKNSKEFNFFTIYNNL